jgi:predicted GIY-YIG superfamily endonuclease
MIINSKLVTNIGSTNISTTGTAIDIGIGYDHTVSMKNIKKELLEKKFKNYKPKRIHKKNIMFNEYFRKSVYILFFKSKIVYIGLSDCPYGRIKQHKDKIFDQFRILHGKKERIPFWEKKLIKMFQPKYNKQYNNRRKENGK